MKRVVLVCVTLLAVGVAAVAGGAVATTPARAADGAVTTTPARAAGASSPHRVDLNGEIETLASTGTPGVAGVKDTDAGILDGTITGVSAWHGALRQLVTWGTRLAITAQGTLFDRGGSLRFGLTGAFVPSPGGLRLSATVAITGATGRYAGARGTLRATGVAAVSAGSTKSSLHLSGALRLPHG